MKRNYLLLLTFALIRDATSTENQYFEQLEKTIPYYEDDWEQKIENSQDQD